MLPEPAEVSESAPPPDPAAAALNSPKHGIRDVARLGSSPQHEAGFDDSADAYGRDARPVLPPVEGVAPANGAPRLKPASPAPRNRIEEYENALAPTPKKKKGLLFEVIKKPRKDDDTSSPIAGLPNGTATLQLRDSCHSLISLQRS